MWRQIASNFDVVSALLIVAIQLFLVLGLVVALFLDYLASRHRERGKTSLTHALDADLKGEFQDSSEPWIPGRRGQQDCPFKKSGKALQALRRSRDLTQGELADAVGKSLAYISEMEIGKRRLSKEVLASIVAVLNLNLDELDGLMQIIRREYR
jgi:DNA-binding XRE family transcriptional regulator